MLVDFFVCLSRSLLRLSLPADSMLILARHQPACAFFRSTSTSDALPLTGR